MKTRKSIIINHQPARSATYPQDFVQRCRRAHSVAGGPSTCPQCYAQRCRRAINHHSAISSFTLMEIMVVMLIIMLLVGITLPLSKYVIKRAKEASRDTNLEKIINALEDYRAAFGEYPIPGDPRHYAQNYISDTEGYSPFTNVPLTSLAPYLVDIGDGDTVTVTPPDYGVEVLPLSDTYNVDYSLTYPLMLGPLLRGEQPFILFPEVTVCYLVYKRKESFSDERKHTVTKLMASGSYKTTSWWTLQGNPINRFKAMDPISEKQLRLECTDGLTYSIKTNSW